MNAPLASVCREPGRFPVPDTRLKVIVTPDNPTPLLETVPPTLKGSDGGGAVIENEPAGTGHCRIGSTCYDHLIIIAFRETRRNRPVIGTAYGGGSDDGTVR